MGDISNNISGQSYSKVAKVLSLYYSATSALDPKTVIDGDTVLEILKEKHPEAE